jgi:RNA polymerase sigma-70 factor (ECF subfamily)
MSIPPLHRMLSRQAPVTPEQVEERQVEHDWIRAAQRGDADAFAELVRLYHARAYWVAYGLLGDEEDSRDVVQEAFIRVLGALERFDFGQSFYTWLYRIVVNLAIDRLRRRNKARATALDGIAEPEANGDSPAHGVESAELRREVHAVLATLPDKYRTVMALRELNGVSCKEIARIVHCSHATVRWRLHVARKFFKEAWERRERQREGLGGAS